MSEGGDEKGKVVAITDRGAKKGASPKDRNAAFKPVIMNRNEVNPFALIRDGHVTTATLGRATMELVDNVNAMRDAATASFRQLAQMVQQLDDANRALGAWLARPWYRRWFRRPPAVPALAVSGETTTTATPVDQEE